MSIISAARFITFYSNLTELHSSEMASISVWYFKATFNKGCYHPAFFFWMGELCGIHSRKQCDSRLKGLLSCRRTKRIDLKSPTSPLYPSPMLHYSVSFMIRNVVLFRFLRETCRGSKGGSLEVIFPQVKSDSTWIVNTYLFSRRNHNFCNEFEE